MTLDKIETLARYIVSNNGITTDYPDSQLALADRVKLARALLLVLPVVRDALCLYDKAEKCTDRPYMGCSMNHDTIVSALDAVDTLRAALEGK